MAQNMKFHALALTALCGVVSVAYYFVGPQQQPQVAPGTVTGDRYIQIDSATWGEECNRYIKEAIDARNSAPIPKDSTGKPLPQPELNMVTHDNVLPAVSNLCNGKLTCDVSPSSDWLGIEPMASCFKKLAIGYRCFAYDRLSTVSIDQHKNNTIDCSPNANSPKTGAAPQTPAAK